MALLNPSGKPWGTQRSAIGLSQAQEREQKPQNGMSSVGELVSLTVDSRMILVMIDDSGWPDSSEATD